MNSIDKLLSHIRLSKSAVRASARSCSHTASGVPVRPKMWQRRSSS